MRPVLPQVVHRRLYRSRVSIGARVRRREDPRLVRGRGRYAGDVALPGLAHASFYRSPVPSGRIAAVDLRAARETPGVLAVWSAADLPEIAAGMGDTAARSVAARSRPVLAAEFVRHVGEAIAVVVAESAHAAADALAAIVIEIDPLPGAGDLETATAVGAPRVHPDLESNVTGPGARSYGDVEAGFAAAAVRVSRRLRIPRISGGYMEPRSSAAHFDPVSGRLTIWASTQWVFGVRDRVAGILGLDRDRVRVLAEDVGGGFGPKAESYPEDVLVALAARRLGRPVRWTGARSDDTASTVQAHGADMDLEMAAGADGRILAVRGRMLLDIGAYSLSGAGLGAIAAAHMLSAYRIPAMDLSWQVVYTNAMPIGFVRGGGRPMGNFAIERLVDAVAAEIGASPAAVRRLNLIPAAEMPFDTRFPAGRSTVVYDGGDYGRLLDAVTEAARRPPVAPGRLLGSAVAMCVESSGFGGSEPARVRIGPDGIAHLAIGSTPQGQGHLTMASQVLAERLGWPLERISVTAGDTDASGPAEMTAGSRSAVQVGNATALAGAAARRVLLERAAERLEADPADLDIEAGVITVRGVPGAAVRGEDLVGNDGLLVEEVFSPARPNAYSSGCHSATVAVDTETGAVELLDYVIAHDTGRAVNPMLVEGQIQGGFAHGIGYALFEEIVYQPDGTLSTASFLDYSIPGAPELSVDLTLRPLESFSDANPEGIRGAGESGTVPVPAAIAGAVEAAIRTVNPRAVVDRLPLHPERVLDLIRG